MDSFQLNIVLSIALMMSIAYGYWKANKSYQQGLNKGAQRVRDEIYSVLRRENIL